MREGTHTLSDRARLLALDHDEPHRILGPHGDVVRAFHPDATSCELLEGGGARVMTAIGPGLFEVRVPGRDPRAPYRLRFHFGTATLEVRREKSRGHAVSNKDTAQKKPFGGTLIAQVGGKLPKKRRIIGRLSGS